MVFITVAAILAARAISVTGAAIINQMKLDAWCTCSSDCAGADG
jgi:hypothetical protein